VRLRKRAKNLVKWWWKRGLIKFNKHYKKGTQHGTGKKQKQSIVAGWNAETGSDVREPALKLN